MRALDLRSIRGNVCQTPRSEAIGNRPSFQTRVSEVRLSMSPPGRNSSSGVQPIVGEARRTRSLDRGSWRLAERRSPPKSNACSSFRVPGQDKRVDESKLGDDESGVSVLEMLLRVELLCKAIN